MIERRIEFAYESSGHEHRVGHTNAFCVLFETSPPGLRHRLEFSSRWSLSSYGEKRLAFRLHYEWLEKANAASNGRLSILEEKYIEM